MNHKDVKYVTFILQNTGGTIAYFFCQWLITVFVVRLLGFEAGGELSLITSFTSLFCFLANFGVRSFQIADIREEYSDGQYFGHRILTSAFAALVAGWGIFFLYRNDFEFVLCVSAYMVFRLFESFTDVWWGMMQRHEQYKRIATSLVGKGIVPLLAFVLGALVHNNLLGAIYWMVVGYAVVTIACDLPILWKMNLRVTLQGTLPLFKRCFPLMIYTLVYPYMTYIVRAQIEYVSGTVELGYYGSVSTVIVVMSTLCSSLSSVLIPRISDAYLQKDCVLFKRLLRFIAISILTVSVVAGVATQLFGAQVLILLFGQELAPYIWIVWPILVASILLMVATLMSSTLIAMKYDKVMLLSNLMGAAVCTVVLFPFARQWKMLGANMGHIIGLLVQCILMAFFLRKAIKQMEGDLYGA